MRSVVELSAAGVPWFPQQYAAEFYATKGVLALVATLLLIVHMNLTWSTVKTRGQRLRYLSLLYFAQAGCPTPALRRVLAPRFGSSKRE